METRRNFLKKVSAATALSFMADWALAMPASDKLGELLPQRQLIRNGEKVTAFCLGGYHLGLTDVPSEAEQMIERSLELGVRFFDNARGYNNGRSEEYMGRFLTPKYRDQIFLMTKAPAKTGEGVQKMLEDSLKALNTDYIDLWQIHALRDPKDVDDRINAGVLDVFLEAKEKGLTRYLGFTGHVNPATHLHFLEFLDKRGLEFDTCQMPLNVYVVGMSELTLANLHQYVYSLPVSSVCSGCRFIYELDENIAVLKQLRDLSDSDKQTLIDLAKPYAGLVVENYKRVLS